MADGTLGARPTASSRDIASRGVNAGHLAMAAGGLRLLGAGKALDPRREYKLYQ